MALFPTTMDRVAKKPLGSHVTRDSLVPVRYSSELNSATSSVTPKRTDRYGILG